jgi:hypothetical protein
MIDLKRGLSNPLYWYRYHDEWAKYEDTRKFDKEMWTPESGGAA